MKIYNTLTRKKEILKTINFNEVRIYSCGPTVYNYIHIGNARPICVFDVLRRYLIFKGYKVIFAQNFTDIDDKIIKRAIEEATDYLNVSQRYIEEYQKDANGLNIMPADINPKATDNIDNMIDMISNLIEKGYAYVTNNGDIYFRSRKFKEYGKLSQQPLDELEAGARISIGEGKEDPLDFALWKAAKPGEPYWDTPWGQGRPGWHIECSAMASYYLGNTIDIHCGGQDLIFPHHENEIAQSECCNDVPFANYWMHNGYINVDNKKMSKSLNNFFTVREVAQKYGYEPIRYLMIAAHYHRQINYSEDIIKQCKSALERLYNCRSNLKFAINNSLSVSSLQDDESINKSILTFKERFLDSLDNDLNTADALSVLFDLAKEININIVTKHKCSKSIAEIALKVFDELTDILGILYNKEESSINDEEIKKLINERGIARKNKDWTKADEIRKKLNNMNVIIEDTPEGVKWKVTT